MEPSKTVETGALLIGPTLHEALKKAIIKYLTKAGTEYRPVGDLLRALGEYDGTVSYLPTAVNAIVEKFIGQKIFGSDIYGDFIRDALKESAEGVVEAIRAVHSGSAEEIASAVTEAVDKAVKKVAELMVSIDENSHAHLDDCPNGKRDTCKQETYAAAVEAKRLVATCCMSAAGRMVLKMPGKADQERSPLDVIGSWEPAFYEDFISCVRKLPEPEQEAAMHAGAELDTENERRAFSLFDDREKMRFLSLAAVRAKQSMRFSEEIQEIVNGFKKLDTSLAEIAKAQRAACAKAWGRLDKPTSIFRLDGAAIYIGTVVLTLIAVLLVL